MHFACEVKGFDPLVYLERKEAKRADPFAQYAIAASVQAMTDAGFDDPSRYNPERLGVIIGSGIGGLKTFEEQHDVYRERGASKISAFFIPMFISDIAAGLVSMRYNAKGPNYATISACATSAHAIGDAYRTIQYGDADVIITGGSEATVTPMAMGGFANMKALSERNESPETASRPFDATRDGFVMGEGGGNRHPRRAAARDRSRRADLRRNCRLRRHWRRVSPDRAGAGRRGRAARDASRDGRRQAVADRDRLHQRARDVDAGQRSERDEGDQGGVRRRASARSTSARPSR